VSKKKILISWQCITILHCRCILLKGPFDGHDMKQNMINISYSILIYVFDEPIWYCILFYFLIISYCRQKDKQIPFFLFSNALIFSTTTHSFYAATHLTTLPTMHLWSLVSLTIRIISLCLCCFLCMYVPFIFPWLSLFELFSLYLCKFYANHSLILCEYLLSEYFL
jgi:hypothetical protein